MTAMPQLVAAFHSLVGMAAVVVGTAAYLNPASFGILDSLTGQIHEASRIEMGLGVAIGAITFSGSVIAFLKLNGNMSGKAILLPGRHVINLGTLVAILGLIGWFYVLPAPTEVPWLFWAVLALSFLIGFLLIISDRRRGYAGRRLDAEQLFRLGRSGDGLHPAEHRDDHHRRAGGLVRRDPELHHVQAMNRSFISVIAGGFGAEAAGPDGEAKEQRPWKRGSAEDAAFLMKQADSVIIVPGYGMAVSQAQHALREMADLLKAQGVSVKYAIHPVAGRMPGHMNVLLAEANVPYDEVFELEGHQFELRPRPMSLSSSAPMTSPIPPPRPTRRHPSMACPSSRWATPRPCCS